MGGDETEAGERRRRRRVNVISIILIIIASLVILFNLLKTKDTDAAEMRAKYGGAASQFLDVQPGFTVHVRDEGPRDAPVLLLLHGSNASLHTWEPWVERLSDRYRVVTLDLQGHGLTGPHPDGCYSSACMADTVEAVRSQLGIERLAIGGSSMGGRVAISWALAHPEDVAAVILVNAAGAPQPETGAAPASGRTPTGFSIARIPVVRDLAAVITPRVLIARSLESTVVVKEPAASPEAVDRYWELLRYPGNRQATIQRFATPTTRVTALELKPLREMPVLILWGADDPLFPQEVARRFADALPDARLALLPGVGHLPQEEAPDESVDALTRFLADLPPYGMPEEALQTAG
ncbi:MAG: alpha/beta fold hydrolase [Thermaurantiacus sp.]